MTLGGNLVSVNDGITIQTFPVPGGPKRRMPFHGDNRPVKYLEK